MRFRDIQGYSVIRIQTHSGDFFLHIIKKSYYCGEEGVYLEQALIQKLCKQRILPKFLKVTATEA